MTDTTLEIGSIIKHLLKKSGINESTLGYGTGLTRATINRVVSGKVDPRISTLNAIANYFNVTTDQLLGKTPILHNTQQAVTKNGPSSVPVLCWEDLADWKDTLPELKPTNHFNWIATDSNIKTGQFATKVMGDSMYPHFQEGSIIVIDPAREPKNRDYMLVHHKKNDDILFRQLITDGKYRLAKPINNLFPPIQLSQDDVVIGTVVQARNSY